MQPGQWLAVHGCGGVGLSAVRIGAASNAMVVGAGARSRALLVPGLVLMIGGCTTLALTGAALAKDITLLNVSYDPTRELYQEYNAAFARYWKAKTGDIVSVIGWTNLRTDPFERLGNPENGSLEGAQGRQHRREFLGTERFFSGLGRELALLPLLLQDCLHVGIGQQIRATRSFVVVDQIAAHAGGQ